MPKLPDLTHLQFLILTALLDGEKSGEAIREAMKKGGVKKEGAAFYALMARLEDAGFVSGSYRPKVIDGQTFKERFYEVTAKGVRAAQSTWAFYNSLGRTAELGGGLSHA